MFTRRRAEFVIVAVLALASAAVAYLLPDPQPAGFVGRYWSNPSWEGVPRATAPRAVPTTEDILANAPWAASGAASAEWIGVLTLAAPATCQFTVRSDDGAWLWIDDVLVVDNGGAHGAEERSGRIDLGGGAHRVKVRHFQAGGGLALSVSWARLGGTPTPLGRGDVEPDAAAAAASASRWLRRTVVALPALWAILLLYLPVRVIGAWMWREATRAAPEPRSRAGLAVVMALAAGLMVWGIEWGARGDDWGPDELRPNVLRDALAQRFSGGWHDKYPAMHYMVLGLPLSAFEFAERIPSLAPDTVDGYAAQLILTRLVSTLMGLGALAAAFVSAAELFGARRAVMAPLALLLTPLFVFYGKLANLDTPALCWFGWALVGFVRVVRGGDRAAYMLLGAGAAAAVATKDQAYASLALLAPVVLVVAIREQPGATWPGRAWSALRDPRLLAGLAAAALTTLVCHNVLFNPSGFAAHLRMLASFNDIAIVPRTAAGAWQLTWRTGDLFRMTLGWPLLILAVAGVVRAGLTPQRRWWLWLLLVPLSFHLAFTLVTFFVCDRYLFPGVFVLALFAGSAMADLFDANRARAAARVVVVAALVVSLLWAASINIMMSRDSRETTRDWVRARAGGSAEVGLIGHYVPYFPPPLVTSRLATTAELSDRSPGFVVVNARYSWRYRTGRPVSQRDLLAGLDEGRLGYVTAFRYRAPLPAWALLQYDASFSGPGESWWTNLDKVNPEMVVYRKRP